LDLEVLTNAKRLEISSKVEELIKKKDTAIRSSFKINMNPRQPKNKAMKKVGSEIKFEQIDL
jgi:hypothetical protein